MRGRLLGEAKNRNSGVWFQSSEQGGQWGLAQIRPPPRAVSGMEAGADENKQPPRAEVKSTPEAAIRIAGPKQPTVGEADRSLEVAAAQVRRRRVRGSSASSSRRIVSADRRSGWA